VVFALCDVASTVLLGVRAECDITSYFVDMSRRKRGPGKFRRSNRDAQHLKKKAKIEPIPSEESDERKKSSKLLPALLEAEKMIQVHAQAPDARGTDIGHSVFRTCGTQLSGVMKYRCSAH
jgi:hypothetical protein